LPIEVSGATGPNADKVNGTYTSTEERLNDKTVYSKLGSTDSFLIRRQDCKWDAGATSEELKDNANNAGFATTEAGLSHPTLAKLWEVYEEEAWQPQPLTASVMVSHFLIHPFYI